MAGDFDEIESVAVVRERPSERVRRYIDEKYLGNVPNKGVRLPTTMEMAKQLGVGVSTVQKVYQKLIEEGELEATQGRGTFVSQKKKVRRVGLCFGDMGDYATELWQSRISGAILQAASRMREETQIIPLHMHSMSSDSKEDGAHFSKDMDGAILFPHPDIAYLAEALNGAALPWVSLHPLHANSTADFVSPDYIQGCGQLGEACIASGRKRVALVHAHPSGKSASNFLRSAGLLGVIGARLGHTIKLRIYDASVASRQTGRDAAANLFASDGFCPDFIFCMGDFIAHGVLSWLEDHGIKCPEQVSVVSGTGLIHDPDPYPGMTCLRQPLEKLGVMLLENLTIRIASGSPRPGVYMPCYFVGGETTLAVENTLLELAG